MELRPPTLGSKLDPIAETSKEDWDDVPTLVNYPGEDDDDDDDDGVFWGQVTEKERRAFQRFQMEPLEDQNESIMVVDMSKDTNNNRNKVAVGSSASNGGRSIYLGSSNLPRFSMLKRRKRYFIGSVP